MNQYQNEDSQKHEIVEMILFLEQNLSRSILIFALLMMTGIWIQNFLISNLSNILASISILFLLIVLCFVNKITKNWKLIIECIVIVLFDSIIIFRIITAYIHKEDTNFTNAIYHEFVYIFIFLFQKQYHSYFLVGMLTFYKVLIFAIIFYFYDSLRFLLIYCIYYLCCSFLFWRTIHKKWRPNSKEYDDCHPFYFIFSNGSWNDSAIRKRLLRV